MLLIRVIKMLMHLVVKNVVLNQYYLHIKIGNSFYSNLRVQAGIFDKIKLLAE